MFKLRPEGRLQRPAASLGRTRTESWDSWNELWCPQHFLSTSQLPRTLSRHTVMPFIVGKTMKTVVFPAAVLPQGSGLESLNSRALKSLAVRDGAVEMEPGHFIFPKVIPPQPAPLPQPKLSLE